MRALLPPRSTPARDLALSELTGRRWDLLVVGGGVTGVAVARDAALRGLSTALIERQDFAFGTSSRSSRLIHGGLRYLANMDFSLVREGLVERRLLLDNAPGLVYPVRFVYPVYRGDPDPVWKVNLGVRLYEALSMGYGLGGSRRLRRRGLERTVPYLRHQGLKGGISYFDAAAHDTRLTLSVALSAARAGAHLVSRCGAVRLIGGGGGDDGDDAQPVTGAVIEDRLGGGEREVRARAVAVCCGPWQKLYATTPMRLRTARGTHLSLRCRRLPLDCYVALRSPRDDRLAFAMPVDRYLVLGTTDDDDTRQPGEVSPTVADSEYLLELANHAFPSVDVELADVTGAWAGLRPLVAEGSGGDAQSGAASADKLSRRHQVTAGPPGLWLLTGGKLTTHRLMAEDCLDEIVPWLETQGVDVGPCRTREKELLTGSIERGTALLTEAGEGADRIERLLRLYGARLETLADRVVDGTDTPATGDRVLDAQIELAVEEEWCLSLDDLLLRRIGPGALDLRASWEAAPRVGRKAAELLGWSSGERDDAVAELRTGLAGDLAATGAPPPAEP